MPGGRQVDGESRAAIGAEPLAWTRMQGCARASYNMGGPFQAQRRERRAMCNPLSISLFDLFTRKPTLAYHSLSPPSFLAYLLYLFVIIVHHYMHTVY